MIVGVISDTHGMLRPEALTQLQGSDHIIHAGDIGSPEILASLQRIAPVSAVRGNVDTEPWTTPIPLKLNLDLGGVRFFVIHNRGEIRKPPLRTQIVIYGHSHQPLIERTDDALYFNPGSAGPRRFKLPISVGRITIIAGQIQPELISLAA